jgi:hypothetical protein
MKRSWFYLFIVWAGVAGALSAAPLPHVELLRMIPDRANVLLVADVQAVYKSPLAQRESWQDTQPLPLLPPQMSEVVLGARFDPLNPQANALRVGVGRLRQPVTMDELARRENGAVETIAQRQAVLSARNAYFVQLDRFGTMGLLAPANRQELARWVRFTLNNPQVILSEFLQESDAATGKDVPIMLAVDLSDTLSPQAIRARLAGLKVAKESTANLDALAKVLASLQGVRLAVRIDDKINGELTAQFGENAEALNSIALPLLQEILAKRGMQMDDLDGWKVDVREKQIVFSGALSDTGLRQVLSLVQLPAPATGEAGPLTKEVKVGATQRYLNSVGSILKDLKKINSKPRNYDSIVVWYEKYADKIDHLPTYNVDDDVVKYGLDMASKLRAVAASLQGEAVSVVNLEASKSIVVAMQPSAGYFSRYYNGGGTSMATNVPQASIQQADVLNKGVDARNTIWRYIDDQSAGLRQALRSKYGVDFQ